MTAQGGQALLAHVVATSGRALPKNARIDALAIEPTLAGSEAERVAALELGKRLLVVCDPATRAALGERVRRALTSVARVDVLELEGTPHADRATANAVKAAAAGADALIAVGSGTINDLCKLAAHELGKPYAVFATAPSMNGYLSVNAAVLEGGLKKSVGCSAPRGAFFDLEVLAAAPVDLIRAGLGDSLCRSTAQCDWLLSHLLLDTPYDPLPFELLAPHEPPLLEASDALVRGDTETMAHLTRTLVLSGLGMTLCGGSQPASQGEHLISHTLEMMGAGGALHGLQIAVTTLTMARLQEALLEGPPPALRATTLARSEVCAYFGDTLGESCWKAMAPKRTDTASAAARSKQLASVFDELRARCGEAHVPAARLQRALERAGCPTSPGDLGWSDTTYSDAVRHAREIRDRYTFLDLAADAGLPLAV